MTYEAEIARQVACHFEGWKWKITEQTGGKFRIPFDVKSEDLPESVKNAPVGTRFIIAIVPLNEDETPRLAPVTSKDAPYRQSDLGQAGDKPKSLAGQAKMLAQDSSFHRYSHPDDPNFPYSHEYMEEVIEEICGVTSCSEIIEGTEAGNRFKQLQAQYLDWKNTPPLEAYE